MPAAAAKADVSLQIKALSVNEIDPAPFNPRKTFDEASLAELAEDIGRRGVLQPVLVRPIEDRFEIVFGERRWRASKLAGLATIPAMIRRMTDLEALEAAIIENQKRADVHPLEEADAYRRLHEKHGQDVDEIAAKVGKSRAHIYGRLKLCELGAEARQAFLEGKLASAIATVVARLPAAVQARAVAEVTEIKPWDDAPMSFRQATEHLQLHFMQDLDRRHPPLAFDPRGRGAGPRGRCVQRVSEAFAEHPGARRGARCKRLH
jgi:ParB/RepB/Spo0J family partition protein